MQGDAYQRRVLAWQSASVLWILVKFTIVALLIITPFRFFVAQPFIVAGASMVPTIDAHEYLVIDELSYRFHKPERGDVVIFRYPLDPDLFFVKRVVGLPGERVSVKDGGVVIGGGDDVLILAEPYVSSQTKGDMAPVQLGAHEYFVLGDNREESADSRVWGPLADRYIVGRALMRVFPFNEATLFPGKHFFPGESHEE